VGVFRNREEDQSVALEQEVEGKQVFPHMRYVENKVVVVVNGPFLIITFQMETAVCLEPNASASKNSLKLQSQVLAAAATDCKT